MISFFADSLAIDSTFRAYRNQCQPIGDGTENDTCCEADECKAFEQRQPHDDRSQSHNDHSGTQRDIKIFQKLRNHCTGHGGIAVGDGKTVHFDMSDILSQCCNQLRIVSCNTHKKAVFRIQKPVHQQLQE